MRTQEYKGYFLTMTYDEKHVLRRHGVLSLRFRDVQLYFKRLRKAKYYCKYVAVGEYGPETLRPHYHVLLWTDAPVGFLQENWKSSRDGSMLGRIHFGSLTLESAMYCMKYVIQPKVKLRGKEKPRAQFSKGIGIGYLTCRMYDFLTEDYENPVMVVKMDGNDVAVPRYYKAKIYTRHQMRIEGHKTKILREEKKEEELKELRLQGIRDPEAYLDGLKNDRAREILRSVKENQTL